MKTRALATIFINSRMSEEATNAIKFRFNKKDVYRYQINSVTLASIKNEYKEKLSQLEQIFIDDKSNVAFRFADCMVESVAFQNLIDNQNIDYFYDIYNFSLNYLHEKREIPFIDASHDIQLQKEDNNCILYTSNFIEGISKMMEDTSIADKIYQLGKKIDQGDQQAKIDMIFIFHTKLKAYLPCYYNQNGDVKSYEQIKEYHLHQRWNLDSEKLNLMPRSN